jgi:hypothetical protein
VSHPQDSDEAAKQPDEGDWFSQTETLRALAQLVRDEKLAELEVSRGAARIVLKKTEAPPPRPAGEFPPAAYPGVEAAGIQHAEELAYVTSDESDAPVSRAG